MTVSLITLNLFSFRLAVANATLQATVKEWKRTIVINTFKRSENIYERGRGDLVKV